MTDTLQNPRAEQQTQAASPRSDNRQGGSAPNPAAARKNQFQARLDNQKAQLERHGNFAEVVIRTTPEGTDMINFARLWEYVLVQADRQTRGYVAKSSRGDFEATRKDFEDCIDFMVQRLKASVSRHKLDLAGTNFISRVAQRYQIVEKTRRAPATQTLATGTVASERPQRVSSAESPAPATAPQPVETLNDDVDAL